MNDAMISTLPKNALENRSAKKSAWKKHEATVAIVLSITSLVISISDIKVFTEWYFEPEVVVSDMEHTPFIIDTVMNGKTYFNTHSIFLIRNTGRSSATNVKLRVNARHGSHIGITSLSEASFVDTIDYPSEFQEYIMFIPNLAPSEECVLVIAHFLPPDTLSHLHDRLMGSFGVLPRVANGRFDGGTVKIIAGQNPPRYNPPGTHTFGSNDEDR